MVDDKNLQSTDPEQFQDELAPLTVPEDADLEDLRFQRGCDWLTDRDLAMYESGHSSRDFL